MRNGIFERKNSYPTIDHLEKSVGSHVFLYFRLFEEDFFICRRSLAPAADVPGGRGDFSCRVTDQRSQAALAIGARREAHRAAHTAMYWQAMQRRDALRWPAQTDR